MMKNLVLVTIMAFFALQGCNDDDTRLTQAEEQQQLEKMYKEIQTIATSETCTEAQNWEYTAIGSKACGGPTGYIAYPSSINTEDFLDKVEDYTEAQEDYNKKWDITSDCSIPPQPSGVRCNNGEAELTY